MKTAVGLENSQTDLILNFDKLQEIVCFVLRSLRVKAKSLNVYFLDAECIQQVHREFFNSYSITDCMSFPIEKHAKTNFRCDFLGEIFVSTKAALEYCNLNDADPYIEVLTYLVHGILHLCGFRDDQEDLSIEMENMQTSLVKKLAEMGLSLSCDCQQK